MPLLRVCGAWLVLMPLGLGAAPTQAAVIEAGAIGARAIRAATVFPWRDLPLCSDRVASRLAAELDIGRNRVRFRARAPGSRQLGLRIDVYRGDTRIGQGGPDVTEADRVRNATPRLGPSETRWALSVVARYRLAGRYCRVAMTRIVYVRGPSELWRCAVAGERRRSAVLGCRVALVDQSATEGDS